MTTDLWPKVFLKPCPFCGQQPEYNDRYAWCHGPKTDKDGNNPDVHGLITVPIENWNKRAP